MGRERASTRRARGDGRGEASTRRWWAALSGLAILSSSGGTARAFCRTTTSGVPADFSPSPGQCWTQGYPLWWRNACVSYDVQKNGTVKLSFDAVSNTMATAFSKWTGVTCPTSGVGTSRVSIDVRDWGPVNCDQVQYNSTGPNQHGIIFRDTNWPHDDVNNTLALTTVVFNPNTGEIYDADMEINTTQINPVIAATIGPNDYDFASIVTHESGHFLGMAHSGDTHATMFAHYEPGATLMRELTEDDIAGICSIYGPNGVRAVATTVSPDGGVMVDACDPTPRHGFTTECAAEATTTTSGCAIVSASGGGGGGGGGPPSAPVAGMALGLTSLVVVGRRRRRV